MRPGVVGRGQVLVSDGVSASEIPSTAVAVDGGAVALKIGEVTFLPGGLYTAPEVGPFTAGTAQPLSFAGRQLDIAEVGGSPIVGLIRGPSPLIGSDGGSIVAAGAGNLIGSDGATLIGSDGASLISDKGVGLIGPDGATLVGPDGASLIGSDGATIVAGGGGALIGSDGASFRASGG